MNENFFDIPHLSFHPGYVISVLYYSFKVYNSTWYYRPLSALKDYLNHTHLESLFLLLCFSVTIEGMLFPLEVSFLQQKN